MEALIDDLINKLSELRTHIAEMGDLEAEHTEAEAALASTTAALATARDDLAKAQSGISVSQLKNLKEHDEAIFTRRKEIEGLDVQIAKAKEDLATLNAQVTSSAQRHDQIEASINSLRKKLA